MSNTTTFAYDKDSNVTSVTDANGHTTTYAYNALNKLTSTTNALNQTTTYSYNSLGYMTGVTDPLNHTTSYTYDAQGRVLTAKAPNGGATAYNYDLAGNLLSLTDPNGNVTKYSYNAANQLVSMTNPQGHQTTYTYNAAGLLTSATDADSRTMDYGYDKDGRETSETWVGGNYTATFAYNADSQLTSASDPNSTYTYTYDQYGNLASVSNAGTPNVPAVTLSYTYDGYFNRASLSDSLGGSITYNNDLDNRMTGLGLTVNGTNAAQLTFSYDAASNMTGITRTAPSAYGDTITSSYGYDKANELTNITDTDTTQSLTLANYTYGYNAGGELTSYQDNSSSALTYGYDTNAELTSASGLMNGSNYGVSYSYDANGNRTMSGYQTGTGNELLSDGTYNYTYDNVGNMTSQTNIATGYVTYYSWDYRNRLTEVEQEDNHGNVLNDEKFTYDVFDNRIAVSLNGTPQLYTVYDGINPYMDLNGSGTLTERYLTNPNGLSQFYGQVSASGTTQWFLTDNLGSVRQVVDTSGNSLDVITYDPYGNIVKQTNPSNGPRFLYASGAYDSISGNEQFDARYYNPSAGRWLIPDPSGFNAGDSNLYRYVFNAPTALTDPTGLQQNSPIDTYPPSRPNPDEKPPHPIIPGSVRPIPPGGIGSPNDEPQRPIDPVTVTPYPPGSMGIRPLMPPFGIQGDNGPPIPGGFRGPHPFAPPNGIKPPPHPIIVIRPGKEGQGEKWYPFDTFEELRPFVPALPPAPGFLLPWDGSLVFDLKNNVCYFWFKAEGGGGYAKPIDDWSIIGGLGVNPPPPRDIINSLRNFFR